MTDDICTMAREVHTLLIAAHPHAGDTNLARAAELATAAIELDGSGDKTLQHETLLAIQTARKTAEPAQQMAKNTYWKRSELPSSG